MHSTTCDSRIILNYIYIFIYLSIVRLYLFYFLFILLLYFILFIYFFYLGIKNKYLCTKITEVNLSAFVLQAVLWRSWTLLSTLPLPLSIEHSTTTTLYWALYHYHSPLSTLPLPLSIEHSTTTTLYWALYHYHSPLSTLPRVIPEQIWFINIFV